MSSEPRPLHYRERFVPAILIICFIVKEVPYLNTVPSGHKQVKILRFNAISYNIINKWKLTLVN